MDFELFTDVGSRNSYSISLNNSGGFTFNSGFFRKNKINNFDFVSLLYAKQGKNISIGFSFSKTGKAGSFKFSKKGGKGGSVFSASFINRYQIDPKQYSGKYPVESSSLPKVGPIFYINLKQHESSVTEL